MASGRQTTLVSASRRTGTRNWRPNDRSHARRVARHQAFMENYFPVTHSTLAINALMTDVLPDYDIGIPLECRLLHLGLNDTYLVKTLDGQYILRVYREGWRSVSEILYELDVLLFLQRENHAVSVPLSRKDGSLIHPVTAPEAIRYVVLFTYAPGKEPTNEVPFYLSSPL